MTALIKYLNKFINAFGYLSALLMFLMVLTVFYDVLMRYLFNDVDIGMQELEWHFFASMFMLGLGYTLKEDGHVRVDVFYENFSESKKAIIDIVGSLIFALPFSLIIIYYGYQYSLDAYTMGEGSADPGGLPNRWIIRSVIPVSFSFLALCVLQVILVKIQSFPRTIKLGN